MCLLIPVFVTCSAIFYKIIEIIIPMKFFNGFFLRKKLLMEHQTLCRSWQCWEMYLFCLTKCLYLWLFWFKNDMNGCCGCFLGL